MVGRAYKRLVNNTSIDRTYQKLNVVLNECGRAGFGTNSKRKVEIPGWNERVKDAHEQYRNAFLQWRRENSPKQKI